MTVSPALLIVGGDVFTADVAQPKAEAVAVVGNRIAAVGSARELVGRFPGARQVDVGLEHIGVVLVRGQEVRRGGDIEGELQPLTVGDHEVLSQIHLE